MVFDFKRAIYGSAFSRKKVKASIKPRGVPSYKNVTLATYGHGQYGPFPRTTRYSPPYEDLSEDLIFQSWIPSDQRRLHKMYRDIHLYDAIAGGAVDLIAQLPYSDFTLVGVKDPVIMKIYEDSVSNLDMVNSIVDITLEFLVIGKVVYSLIFDGAKGIWSDMVPQDIDYCRIEQIPIHGVQPKIDVKIDNNLRRFLTSKDPRDVKARSKIPSSLVKRMLSSEWVPLEPLNTLFVGRRTSPNDIGTSIYTRVLPFYAIEKSLIDGTIIASRRRQRAILHITAGIDDVWEPTDEEMDAIASMFIQADEDPHGAVVVTRTGVMATEVRSPTDFWRLSEEYDFLSNAKMRALGINESFLSGESTYNTMEVALSVFIEMIRNLRDVITDRVFYKKIFATLARVHGFIKRTEAELSHRVRLSSYTLSEMESIPLSELVIPQVRWSKHLRPEADDAYIEVLSKMEEKGLVIPLRFWASAGGLNLDSIIDSLEEDVDIRKKIEEFKKRAGLLRAEEGEGGGVFSSYRTTSSLWNGDRFMDLSSDEFLSVVKEIVSNDGKDPMEIIANKLDHNEDKIHAACYLLNRIGYHKVNLPPREFVDKAMEYLSSMVSDDKIKNRQLLTEGSFMRKIYNEGNGEPKSEIVNREIRSLPTDSIPNDSKYLYSGI